MKITKLGHCCLIVDVRGTRFLTDPGNYTTAQDSAKNIDYVVITHEHTDHLHVESVKKIIENNPEVVIICNTSVGKILDREQIKYQKLLQGEISDFDGVTISAHGTKHAVIYKDYEQVENTGYLFDNTFFIPGDAFYVPEVKVDILAFPIGAPWSKISESIDYVVAVKPRIAFGIHDGNLVRTAGLVKRLPELFLSKTGIQCLQLELGKETVFE